MAKLAVVANWRLWQVGGCGSGVSILLRQKKHKQITQKKKKNKEKRAIGMQKTWVTESSRCKSTYCTHTEKLLVQLLMVINVHFCCWQMRLERLYSSGFLNWRLIVSLTTIRIAKMLLLQDHATGLIRYCPGNLFLIDG